MRGRYLPALDGVRAIAIAGVFAFHLRWQWASGGFLGVDLFFVLSGFLITSLLVEEWADSGRIRLGAFWARRALRLLPALLFMLLVLGAFYLLAGPGPLVDLHVVRSDAIATVLYVANWNQLFSHQSYFDLYAAPSPLQHTWSLAIEEQFYLLWPFAVLGVMAIAKRWHLSWRRLGVVLTALAAAASAAWMAALAAGGASVNRLYYGTDTRAFDLLCGAVLAWWVASRPQPGPVARRLLALAALPALAVLGLCWWKGGGAGGVPWRWMFEWGFLLCAVAGTVVIADVRQERLSVLGRVLAVAPLRVLGRISYELYLWHWPVICELTAVRLGVSGVSLDAIQISVSLVLAAGTHYLIAQPIRRWGLRSIPTRARWTAAPVGMLAAVAVMLAATVPASAATAGSTTVASVATVPSTRPSSDLHKRSIGGAKAAAPLTTRASSSANPASQPDPAVPGAGWVVGGPIALPVPISAAHPLRILLLGDSVMLSEAPAVEAALESTGAVQVTSEGVDGWGLTTDTAWRQSLPGQIQASGANLVVAMWGWDGPFAMAHPATYTSWLRAFTQLVISQPGVAGLVFEQFPVLGPTDADTQTPPTGQANARNIPEEFWNKLAQSMVPIDPHKVAFAPLAPAVERDGKWATWLPPGNDWSAPASQWVRVRMLDGVHFCAAGAARYADALLADLTTMFHLPAASPDWSTGSWTNDPQAFGAALQECPDDHPPG